MPEPAVREFRVEVDDAAIGWIHSRVKTARIIPDILHPKGQEWEDGTPSSDLEDLRAFWSTQYDWRRVEAKLNETYKMFTVDLDEGDETINLHFVHHRSEREDAIPLIFAHGWPGNFTEVESLLPLTNPVDPQQQAFHIVAPTLPGFVFSSAPKAPGFTVARIARVYHKLMLTLGYKHYIGQGGDWGSFILRSVAVQYPEAIVGLHINLLVASPPSPLKNPLAYLRLAMGWLTPIEKRGFANLDRYLEQGTGYSRIQGTKPQTISHALLDSPVGMLSWIREKLASGVEPDYVWDKETVITWTMLYLLSNSAGHARIYKAAAGASPDIIGSRHSELAKEVFNNKISGQVAVGASYFPQDLGFVPRWWADATLAENITFWKFHEKGGHFASVEVPELFIQDILEFVQTISLERKKVLLGQ